MICFHTIRALEQMVLWLEKYLNNTIEVMYPW